MQGIRYIHKLGYVHRDLKPENILIDARDPENPIVKITDFGFAKKIED